MPASGVSATDTALLDAESQAWIDRLSPGSPDREAAMETLHALLLKATRFEINRRRAAFPQLRGNDHDDLAHQSADDALVALLGKLGLSAVPYALTTAEVAAVTAEHLGVPHLAAVDAALATGDGRAQRRPAATARCGRWPGIVRARISTPGGPKRAATRAAAWRAFDISGEPSARRPDSPPCPRTASKRLA